MSNNDQQRTGRVVTRYGAELLVKIDNNEVIRCTAKRKFDHVACGDNVTIELADHGNARLIDIAPRKNALTRPDYSHKLKTIAANIDQLVIIMSWRPDPFWELLDRYLVTAHLLDATAVIVMNKDDLAAEYATEKAIQSLEEYQQIGYRVIKTVADSEGDSEVLAKNSGLKALHESLDDKTSVLVGQSGVGKSSLATLLLPDIDIVVGEVSNSGEGKHTTTTTTLYELPSGGGLIDSPGVRDFVLPDINELQLREGYKEFADYSPYCKFNNCSHAHEPGCKVRQALADGELPASRYRRYLKLLSDIN
ncbi:MAG: ribosome small subunit-dependent GTPase A [Thiotrichaceae bacterium]